MLCGLEILEHAFMSRPAEPGDPARAGLAAPRWVAHRGAGQLAPENTLAAFRRGHQLGYRAFECDVKLSADEVPFLLHDDTLERTTNGRGNAGRLPWATLATLDAGAWHGTACQGERLPTLAELARELHRQQAWLDLEIKPCPGTDRLTGHRVAELAAHLWQTEPQRQRLLLSSFSMQALEAAQQAAPELHRALLLDTLWPGWEAAADRLQVRAVVTDHRLMNDALVRRLHQQARLAMVYTVNDVARARQLLAMGVDSLITDAVDVLPAALAD